MPIPAGEYVTNDASVTYRSSRAKALSGSIRLAGGGFFNGTNYSVSGAGTRLAWSTRLFPRASAQFNSQTDELVTNVRFNWIYAPVSDVFLVYTERRLVRGALPGSWPDR